MYSLLYYYSILITRASDKGCFNKPNFREDDISMFKINNYTFEISLLFSYKSMEMIELKMKLSLENLTAKIVCSIV